MLLNVFCSLLFSPLKEEDFYFYGIDREGLDWQKWHSFIQFPFIKSSSSMRCWWSECPVKAFPDLSSGIPWWLINSNLCFDIWACANFITQVSTNGDRIVHSYSSACRSSIYLVVVTYISSIIFKIFSRFLYLYLVLYWKFMIERVASSFWHVEGWKLIPWDGYLCFLKNWWFVSTSLGRHTKYSSQTLNNPRHARRSPDPCCIILVKPPKQLKEA